MALNSGLWADLWCGWRSRSSSSSPRHHRPSCSGPSSVSCEPLFFWCSPSRWPCSTGSRPWWTTLVEEESFQGVGACPANLRLNSIWETWRKVKGIWPLWPWGHSCIDREQSHRKWKFFFQKKNLGRPFLLLDLSWWFKRVSKLFRLFNNSLGDIKTVQRKKLLTSHLASVSGYW